MIFINIIVFMLHKIIITNCVSIIIDRCVYTYYHIFAKSSLQDFNTIVQFQSHSMFVFMPFYQRQRFYLSSSLSMRLFFSVLFAALLPSPKENKTADTSKEIAYLRISGCYITKLNIHKNMNKLRL